MSTLSLTAIALDRLEAVTHATVVHTSPGTRPALTKIILINTISSLAVLPYCVHMEVRADMLVCWYQTRKMSVRLPARQKNHKRAIMRPQYKERNEHKYI